MPGIIGIPSYLSNNDIDLILSDFISKHDPEKCFGKAIKITESEVLKIKKHRQP